MNDEDNIKINELYKDNQIMFYKYKEFYIKCNIKDEIIEELKKENHNYKITINILKNIIIGDEKDNYGCPIYLFESKDKNIKKREYNCKYLIDLYEKYKSEYINKDDYGYIQKRKVLNNTAIHILRLKNIEPNRSNTENWRIKIKKVYEIYELYKNDIYIIFFNIDKMANIRNNEKWKLWILYLKSKIEEKKKLNIIINLTF